MFELLIQNGTVVTETGIYSWDVALSDGKIAAVGAHGTLGPAAKAVDASGMLVLPGLVDPHVHIHHPFKGGYSADDFYTATRSAAFGGVTTVCDFAIQWDRERSITDTCELRKSQFDGQAVTDYAFHACPTRSDSETLNQLPHIIAGGVPSMKMYMTYSRQGRMSDDAALYEALKVTAECGGIVGVHAENDAMCCYYSDEFKKAGRTSPHEFPLCKPDYVEAEAVNRAVYLAKITCGRLYIFHLSCAKSLDIIRQARAEGVQVCAETCIHYLTMDMSKYERPDGANFICSPPLRSKEDVAALWSGINEGLISVVSSDHCGFSRANKASGNNAFAATPNGLPGMETRLSALYSYGVQTGRITLPQMVALLSTNPAKVFGMAGRKGSLTPGADGDVVILDSNASRTISADVLHSPVDWSPYDGETLSGVPVKVYRRGELIVDGDECLAKPGSGTFLVRRAEDTTIL